MSRFGEWTLGVVVVLWCAAIPMACVEVTEPEAPQIIIPENTGDCTGLCECDLEAMKKRSYRLTRLEIDEPKSFAQTLNTIWKADVTNNVLNVVFTVTNAVQEEGSAFAFDQLDITFGPAWRDPLKPDIIPMEDVTSYCLLDGLEQNATMLPYHGYQCQMKSEGVFSLYFHSGPKNNPYVCAPKNVPMNNIPVKNLAFRASFNRDCTELINGSLEGCLTLDDADRICMCPLKTGTCPLVDKETRESYPIDPAGNEDTEVLQTYCKEACGTKWISFGALVRAMKGIYPNCLTSDGIKGYRIQGFFDASEISEGRFNPVQSDDCLTY